MFSSNALVIAKASVSRIALAIKKNGLCNLEREAKPRFLFDLQERVWLSSNLESLSETTFPGECSFYCALLLLVLKFRRIMHVFPHLHKVLSSWATSWKVDSTWSLYGSPHGKLSWPESCMVALTLTWSMYESHLSWLDPYMGDLMESRLDLTFVWWPSWKVV